MTTTVEKFVVPVKHERWRFSGLKELELKTYEDAMDANSFRASEGVKIISGKQLSPEDRAELGRPFYDMGSRALDQQGPQVYGAKLQVPAGNEAQANLYAMALDSNTSFRGRVLVEVEPDAQLTLLEQLGSQGAGNLFVTGTRLRVQRGATLNYVLMQDAPLDAKVFNLLEIEAHKDAQVNLIILNLGGAYVRQEVTAIMKGERTTVNLRSLSLATGTQEIDQRTLQIHEAPNAKSDLLFKNILDDKARTIFSGLIRVAPGAQKTDAYQKNRNLILSDDAQANSLPGLEIEANDVRCTHGATCGKLSDEELFYLRARGIGKKAAQRMLVAGYAEEIFSGVIDEDLATLARGKLEARMG